VDASAAEDGTIRLWEMENGNAIKSWAAHPGGITSARFAKDGRLVTTGRDRSVSVWDQNGGKQKDFEKFNDLALRAVFADDDSKVVAGDWSGEVRVLDPKDGKKLANILANPLPIASRLEQARLAAKASQDAVDLEKKNREPVQAKAAELATIAEKARQSLAEAQKDAQSQSEAVANLVKAQAEKAKAQADAAEVLKQAQASLDKATAEKIAAEKAVAETSNQEKSLAEAIPAAKLAVEKSLNDKVAHDQSLASAVEALKSASNKSAADQASTSLNQALARSTELLAILGNAGKREAETLAAWEKAVAAKTAAPGLFASSIERVIPLTAAVDRARTASIEAENLQNQTVKQLAEARAKFENARSLAEVRKKEAEAGTAAHLAAEKVLAEKNAVVESLSRKADEMRAEVQALEIEQKFAEAAREVKTN
jgi:hypothetical protein